MECFKSSTDSLRFPFQFLHIFLAYLSQFESKIFIQGQFKKQESFHLAPRFKCLQKSTPISPTIDLSNTLLPQTQREKNAEITEAKKAALKEEEKIQNAKEEKNKTALCW